MGPEMRSCFIAEGEIWPAVPGRLGEAHSGAADGGRGEEAVAGNLLLLAANVLFPAPSLIPYSSSWPTFPLPPFNAA